MPAATLRTVTSILPPFLCAVLCLATGGHAATIAVTTTDDVIAVDGLCSLREAVTAANGNAAFSDCPQGEAPPAVDVIELPAGTYSLTLLPIGEDANLGGDLDITEQVTLRGLGDDFIWWDDPKTPEVETLDVFADPESVPRSFEATDLPAVVIENGLGKEGFPGDGDRVIHILEAGKSAESSAGGGLPLFTLENLAVARGDATCSGIPCSAGAGGLFMVATADLLLRRVALFGNRVSCSGASCGQPTNAAALRVDQSGSVSLESSVVADHRSSCADSGCRSGRVISVTAPGTSEESFSVSESLFIGNVSTCSATDCETSEMIRVNAFAHDFSQVLITDNEASCAAAGLECLTREIISIARSGSSSSCNIPDCSNTWSDVEISENVSTCSGDSCRVSEIFDGDDRIFRRSFHRMRFRANEQRCVGPSCGLLRLIDEDLQSTFAGASLSFSELEILDNVNFCEGTECSTEQVLGSSGLNAATLEDVFIRGESLCVGDDCVAQQIVDLSGYAAVVDLEVRDSVVSCTGAGCRIGRLASIVSSLPLSVETLTLADSQTVCSGIGCGEIGGGDPGDGGLLELGFIDITLTNATITGNLTNLRGTVALNGAVSIVDSVISGNESTSDGGGILAGFEGESADLVLSGTAVDGNVAGGNGGGLFIPDGSTLSLFGGSIASNTAADGGGIYNAGTVSFAGASPFSGNAPNDCVDVGPGSGCLDFLFIDGFESGDTSIWSTTSP